MPKIKIALIVSASLVLVFSFGYFTYDSLIKDKTNKVLEDKESKDNSNENQEKDETADWETYKTEYGFSFKHSKDLAVQKVTKEEMQKVQNDASAVGSSFEDTDFEIQFFIEPNFSMNVFKSSEHNLDAWLGKKYPKEDISDFQSLDINGYEVLSFKDNDLGLDSYYVKVNNKVLGISIFDYPEPDKTEEINEYNRLLKIFVGSIKELK